MSNVLGALDTGNYRGDNGAGIGSGAAMLDLTLGGNNGDAPVFGGVAADGSATDLWVSNHAYISQDIIPVVLKTPLFFDFLENPTKWKNTWKAIFQKHAISITGLSSGLTVETEEEEIGGIGEFQESIKDTKKARSTITVEIRDRMHKSIQRYIDFCIRYGQKDYLTKKPLISNYIDDISVIAGGYTPDYYTGSILFIEPDVTRMSVVDAWFSTQIFFKGNGERTGKRELAAGGEGLTISLTLASVTLSTDKVMELAEKILPTLTTITTMDSDILLPADGIAPDLQ